MVSKLKCAQGLERRIWCRRSFRTFRRSTRHSGSSRCRRRHRGVEQCRLRRTCRPHVSLAARWKWDIACQSWRIRELDENGTSPVCTEPSGWKRKRLEWREHRPFQPRPGPAGSHNTKKSQMIKGAKAKMRSTKPDSHSCARVPQQRRVPSI